MSLSKFFKDQGDFKAEKLLPRTSPEENNWQAVSLSRPVANTAPPVNGGRNHSHDTNSIPQSIEESLPSENQHGSPASPQPEPDLYQAPGNQQNESPQQPVEPQVDIEELKTAAFQEGLKAGISQGIEEGIRQGLQQAESDFGLGLAALNQVCEQLSSLRETILKNSKPEIVDLVFGISEKIIRHSLEDQDQTIVETIDEALNQAVRSSEFVIYLNPEDVEAVNQRKSDFISNINGLENIILKADPKISRGGCKIESENCTVDATIASQLDILKGRIKDDL